VISVLSQEGFEVTQICEVLEVARSAYYAWRDAQPNLYQQQDQQLQPMVHDVFTQHRRRYGARRIARELQASGQSCSRSKARKIMDQMGLEAIQPRSFKPRTTESKHTLGYSDNLLLDGICVVRANQVWVGDITYIALAGKFAYLAMLMDLWSRRIVGWSLATHMEESLVMQALKLAIGQRQPPPGLIHHTDRGGQYAGGQYRQILKRAGMNQSMSRAGDCYDNAFMESCFGTIKTELQMTVYQTFQEALKEIQEYVNYYNTQRRHSSLDYQSPTSFETACNS
jgi:transposase InsO family protein